MPNLKASIKDYRNSQKKKENNLRMKRRYKTATKEFQKNLETGEVENAKKSLSKTFKLLDKAAKTKLLKKNTASRKKSRLTKSLNKVINTTAKNVKTTK
jgi:small subunit ribosomal protein S20